MRKVVDIKPTKDVDELVRRMEESGGFVAKKVGVGVDILEKMVKDEESLNFFSFPACIIATGTRGIIRELVRRKLFDVVITTCGMLDHDLARIWRDYYHGSFLMDDEELRKRGINRLGNVLVPDESYGIVLEDKLQPILKEIWEGGKKELATHELVWEIGRRLKKEEKKEESIIYWAYKNEIPVVIPGPMDGAVGSQIWLFSQDHDFKVDVIKDEKFLSSLVFDAKRSGALMIGGGISKHHVIWWNQFKGGLDYAVYITTAPEWDGSLSGARLREAVSWGKVKGKAKYITIEGDATVLLPLMISSLLSRLGAL
ncbi:deoxyhypusine synthase [Nanoarchaeota archaeon]|nr:MAG: deoxyhypusine synthase [Nanoarchaeota archaeon]